jgi:hypothetical protein
MALTPAAVSGHTKSSRVGTGGVGEVYRALAFAN